MVGISIDRVLSSLIKADVDIENQGEFIKSFLGDLATLELVPTAIDYYMVKTRRSDSTASAGAVPLGGESSSNYDRIQAVKDIALLIAARVVRNRSAFLVDAVSILLRTTGTKLGMTIDGKPSDLLTADPRNSALSYRFIARYGVPVVAVGDG